MNQYTILIIDDDDNNATVAKFILTDRGHNVKVASTGAAVKRLLNAARKQGEDRPFDLILLDLMMPDMDGREIFRWLRRQRETENTPVIVVSAISKLQDRAQLLDMGADDYLVKPYTANDLVARVDIYLQLSQLRRSKQKAEQRYQLSYRQLQEAVKHNEQLVRQEQRRREQAEYLHKIAQTVTSSLEMEDVLQRAMDAVCSMIDVESGSILLRDEESGELLFVKTLHPTPELAGQRIKPRQGIAGHVAETRQPLLLRNARQHPHFYPGIDQITNRQTRSLLCVPLIAHGRLLGVLELINKKDGEFTELDLTLTNAAAASIAIAIENARLYHRQKMLTAQLQEAQSQFIQSERMAAMGRLAGALAHEINNPLQAIHSSLQLVLDFDLDEAKKTEYVQMAHEEVERLVKIGGRILNFVRPPAETLEPIYVNTIVRQVIKLVRKYIAHSNCSVNEKLASDIPPVQAAPEQLAQVFLAVLLNALDAMQDEPGELTIITTVKGKWVEVIFADTGSGFTSEAFKHMFDPFFSTREGHVGLGLTAGYVIMERLGGCIMARNRRQKGAIVTIRLPWQ